MTVQCCCCGQVRDKAGQWAHPETKPQGNITHTYCGPCYEAAKGRMKAYRAIAAGAALSALVPA